MIYLKILILALFLTAINITDVKSFKIKNKTILPVLIIGLVLGFIEKTFMSSVYGMFAPLVLFPLFCLKMLGAGDIKAMCAVGALLGVNGAIDTMLFSFIFGGVIALVFMLANKNFIERFKYLFTYLKLCFMTRQIEKYNYGGEGEKSYFRFSYAITCGAAIAVVRMLLLP